MKILAIKGGGVRGLLAAKLASRLERRYGDFDEGVDLYAGVSAGALIAVGRAASVEWSEIVRLYRRCAKRVFNLAGTGDPAATSRERATRLREVLVDVFDPDRNLSSLDRDVLVVSVDGSGSSWRPRFWTRQRDGSAKIVDVLLASTAAPFYFPAHHGHIDGGVLMNDPSLAGLIAASGGMAALGMKALMGSVSVLTLGCGRSSAPRGMIELMASGGLLAHVTDAIRLLGDMHHELDPKLGCDVPLDGGHDLEASLQYLSGAAKAVKLKGTEAWLDRHGW